MRRAVAAAALAAAGVAGGVVGASTYAGLDAGTTTVVREVRDRAQPAALTTASSSVNAVYRRARAGVVEITVTGAGGFPGGSSSAQGSGFVYDRDGHVVTNDHVVEGGGTITVRFASGRTATATLVGQDPSTDLAVLKVDVPASQLTPLVLGDSDEVAVGDDVVAIGSPFGLEGTVTSGIVSALHRQMTSPNEFTIDDSIQTDAAINHGNSGGPLLDLDGDVIGVNAQIESDSGGNDGVGFAIPSNTVRSVVRQIVATGRAQHAYLGVGVADSATPRGARLTDVRAGTPAADARLRVGDVVTRVGGKRVGSADELRAAVSARKPGDAVVLAYVRGGETHRVRVELTDRPEQVS